VSAKPGQHHLFEYIKAFYNDNRRHSSLEFASPVRYGKTRIKAQRTKNVKSGGLELPGVLI
jgi:hypothetical protein